MRHDGAVLASHMAIAVFPHLIPAVTIPNGDIERALSEPLAVGRDEVLYLICSHPRVAFGMPQPDATYPVLIAGGRPGGGIAWTGESWWARVALPRHASPSKIPWAIIDTALDWAERLPPIVADFGEDPDGEAAQNRQELLPWIYDRHLELTRPATTPRGRVDGGVISLRIEYVGRSGQDALRRPAGAHHKVPTILGRMLLYEPHHLVYLMACEIRIAIYDPQSAQQEIEALRINQVVDCHDIDRALLIAAAEDALIAAVGAPYNKRNTGLRRFPRSSAGEHLARLGVQRLMLAFYGLPRRVQLIGSTQSWRIDTPAVVYDLAPR
jgi:hypothetical protein